MRETVEFLYKRREGGAYPFRMSADYVWLQISQLLPFHLGNGFDCPANNPPSWRALRDVGGDCTEIQRFPLPEYHKMIEKICEKLNFTSLRYQSLEGMLDSIGIDPEDVCTYCWNGKE